MPRPTAILSALLAITLSIRAAEDSVILPEFQEHCVKCHGQNGKVKGKVNLLGFALENFDPIGNWRAQYENGREVDMAGSLFRKHQFEDI